MRLDGRCTSLEDPETIRLGDCRVETTVFRFTFQLNTSLNGHPTLACGTSTEINLQTRDYATRQDSTELLIMICEIGDHLESPLYDAYYLARIGCDLATNL